MSRRRRSRGKATEPRPMGSVLDGVLERLGVARAVEHHEVFNDWEARVGAEIAAAARPHRIDGDTLIVHVVDSAWLNELSLRQRELLERVNVDRRRTRVERILFRLDPDTNG